MDKNNKDIYYSKYASEMRSLIKEQNKKIKQKNYHIKVLIIMVILSLMFASVFNHKYNKQTEKIKELNNLLIEKENDIDRLNDKLKNKNIEIENKVEESDKYKKEINELNEKINFYEIQTGKFESKVTNKINLNISDFKSWMPYTAITDKNSLQYKIICQATPDENGIMKISNFYCAALGSAYGKVGDKFKITTDTGNIFYIIKADQKSDQHTIGDNKTSLDGSKVEFIVDKNNLNKEVKKTGNVSIINQFSGKIKNIEVC